MIKCSCGKELKEENMETTFENDLVVVKFDCFCKCGKVGHGKMICYRFKPSETKVEWENS